MRTIMNPFHLFACLRDQTINNEAFVVAADLDYCFCLKKHLECIPLHPYHIPQCIAIAAVVVTVSSCLTITGIGIVKQGWGSSFRVRKA